MAIKKQWTAWKPRSGNKSFKSAVNEHGVEKDYFYTCLFPVAPFLNIFGGNPVGFSNRLERDAEGLMEEWASINRESLPFDRTPTERSYPLHGHSFRGENNICERSVYEMQISTYGYTEKARKVEYPEPLLLRDLKASG